MMNTERRKFLQQLVISPCACKGCRAAVDKTVATIREECFRDEA
jgi:hypothetical protein